MTGQKLAAHEFGQDREKFATYFRDSTTYDYADQRYFASQYGRFLTPDPAEPGGVAEPLSWNLYAYVGNDPVNYHDPEGLVPCGDLVIAESGRTLKEVLDPKTDLGLLALLTWAEAAAPTYATILTKNYFQEREAIAISVLNRWKILNGVLSITGVRNVASLGWGPAGATLQEVIGWPRQYAVIAGGPGNPGLNNAKQAVLDSVLKEEQSTGPWAIPFDPRGPTWMTTNCVNLWQTWVVAWQALTGQVKDPFASQGLTTSFNSDPNIEVGGLEERFGAFGTPNVFFGIPKAAVGPPRPRRAVDEPRPRGGRPR